MSPRVHSTEESNYHKGHTTTPEKTRNFLETLVNSVSTVCNWTPRCQRTGHLKLFLNYHEAVQWIATRILEELIVHKTSNHCCQPHDVTDLARACLSPWRCSKTDRGVAAVAEEVVLVVEDDGSAWLGEAGSRARVTPSPGMNARRENEERVVFQGKGRRAGRRFG